MTLSARNDIGHGVLVHAPTGRDAELTCRVLTNAQLMPVHCRSVEDLGGQLKVGAGAVLLAEEALDPTCLALINGYVDEQPAWSDLPLIVFTSKSNTTTIHGRFSTIANLTILERPTHIGSLISVIKSALRTRQRQYETCQLLERLQETDRRKDEFLAMLGHELRNPLGAIRTAVSMLDDIEHRHRRAVAVIERQAANLAHILDDLLDVSRVLSGKIALRRSVFDLSELARRIAQEARGAEQDISIEIADDALPIEGDPVRIEQIISNLLSNAIKYTPASGHVHLQVCRDGSRAIIRVSDDGVGLDPEHLTRIFEPFVQADASIDRSRGGLGLGLPLVRGLVELHGGSVRAESHGLGLGSTFIVTLPTLKDMGRARSKTPKPEADRAATGRVLVVDDNEDLLELMASFLTRLGFEVEAAKDGKHALDQALKFRPDVILLDIGLPQLDGYEVARRIRSSFGRERPLLVAVTGYGQAADREQARRAGFDHHFVKPVEPKELLALVRAKLSEPS